MKVATVRTTGFDPADCDRVRSRPPIETVQRWRRPIRRQVRASSSKEIAAKLDRPELTAAKIIVSGGRAMGSSGEVQRSADRAAGRQAWAPRSAPRAPRSMPATRPTTGRSGQTGKIVAPQLYVACRYLGRDPAPGRHEGLEGHRLPSTRTRRRRSSRSPTTVSSAISSPSSRRSRKPLPKRAADLQNHGQDLGAVAPRRIRSSTSQSPQDEATRRHESLPH